MTSIKSGLGFRDQHQATPEYLFAQTVREDTHINSRTGSGGDAYVVPKSIPKMNLFSSAAFSEPMMPLLRMCDRKQDLKNQAYDGNRFYLLVDIFRFK